ncbi:glycosyltransferase involved in cell wall biosynthesis [Sphingorhabdus rigui]|uniref:Glycosyltransferase involved in cell wall biosynthesis n=1 Tax=Sphingorhabdus rigui TaxID=1282858 RepID=A0A840B040_9SPHN|nr:glycosyltransferase family 4 protein [Sphingorhabdus rigui]MBB3943271.1 glycosyltransferase involved in cell wall biosynthesis [Sphingorhabdus rigui]
MTIQLPAFRFEAEAFQLGKDKILGRQSAGYGFLRALLALPELDELVGYGPTKSSDRNFEGAVSRLKRDVATQWVTSGSEECLAEVGGVHFPDPVLAEPAKIRLAYGSAAWSITGITHTICSRSVMAELADYTLAPLMEWDGLILTSDAVKASVEELLTEQESYVAWRFPDAKPAPRPQLPVIPLGVHSADYAFTLAQKNIARRALGIDDREVVFLYVGRLSFHAKANPWPMYKALEEASRRTGQSVTLIQCGWFSNSSIESVFRQGADVHAPSVRHIWLDGRVENQRNQAWAAGNIFVSLSDNIQETFGLTPLEAMAAGMPVLVSDWNGYRQTVQNGVTGFMVPTFAPAPDFGEAYAQAYASDAMSYDYYLAHTARHISVDLAALFDAAEALVKNADSRRAMGLAGQKIARNRFDWSIIIREYLALWDELGLIRRANVSNPRFSLRKSADRLSPFRLFAGYPSKAVDSHFRFRLRRGDCDVSEFLSDPLFGLVRETLPDDHSFSALIAGIHGSDCLALEEAADRAGMPLDKATQIVTALMKGGVIEAA